MKNVPFVPNISNIVLSVDVPDPKPFDRYRLFDKFASWFYDEKDRLRKDGNYYSYVDPPTFHVPETYKPENKDVIYQIQLPWIATLQKRLWEDKGFLELFLMDAACFSASIIRWWLGVGVDFSLSVLFVTPDVGKAYNKKRLVFDSKTERKRNELLFR